MSRPIALERHQRASERRAYPRHAVFLDALLTVKGLRPWPCKIRDFCLGGMFLAFDYHTGESISVQDNAIARGDVIDIDFCVPTEGMQKRFRLQAEVARTFEGGIGVAFSEPDPTALLALQRLASKTQQKLTSAYREHPVDVVAGSSQEKKCSVDVYDVLAASKELLANHLPTMLHVFFREIDKRLVVSSRDAQNNVEQSYYFDAITELRKREERIIEAFCRSILDQMDQLVNLEAPKQKRKEEPLPELSLVEKDDFEEFLTIAEIISNVESCYRESLYAIAQRFSYGLEAQIDNENNPVAPAAICHAFRDALEDLSLNHMATQVIYKVFEELLVHRLGAFYDALNGMLKTRNVLPVLAHKPSTRGQRPSPRQVPPPQRGEAVPPNQPTPNTPTALDTPEFSPTPVAYRDAPRTSENQREITQSDNPVAPSVSRAREEAMQGAYRTAKTLLGLQRWIGRGDMHRDEEQQPRSEAIGVQASGRRLLTYDTKEVVDALSVLQHERGAHGGEETHELDLKARLVMALGSPQVGAERKQFRARDNDIIDVMENLFHSILKDKFVPESTKPWLKRLQVPLQKIAILDEDFFCTPSHPARQVLNQLAHLKMDVGELSGITNKDGQHSIDELIETIVDEFDQDIGVFHEALQQLEILVNSQEEMYARNVDRVVRSWEEQQAFIKARRNAAEHQAGDGDVVTGGKGFSETRRKAPDEWIKWLNRAKRLRPGDAVVLGDGSEGAQQVTLVWIGEGFSPYVFVDRKGMKAATLSLQELAMQMRRGKVAVLEGLELPVVDRALYTMLHEMHEQLEHQASHDPLTGLVNRKAFEGHLERVLKNTMRERSQHVLCSLDLDRFKIVNNTCGHAGGDALLKEISNLLQKHVGKNGMLARLGSDEFGILLEQCSQSEGYQIAEQQRKAIQAFRFTWENETLFLSASIGLVPIDHKSDSVESLLKAADAASFAAKDAGRNRIQVYQSDDRVLARREEMMSWAARLHRTLDEDRLQLRCQRITPIVHEASTEPHYEILLGVRDDAGNPIPPGELIQAAECYDQMPVLDRWVIQTAFRWMASHREKLDELGGCAINLSGQSLNDEYFMEYVLQQFYDSKVVPERVCFEVTETAAVASLSNAKEFIRTMKEFGCRFSLDDFGSGHSSYAYLTNLPVDYLKIDGLFIKDIVDNPNDYAVVKSINEIGHFMGMKTIAEYVENHEILEKLREIGVDYAQGFGIEKPRYLEEIG